MKRFKNICLCGMQDINSLGWSYSISWLRRKKKEKGIKNPPSIYKKKTWRNRSLFTIKENPES